MATEQFDNLVCEHNGVKLYLYHDTMNIGTSPDADWTNAAIALCKRMREWQKDPTEAIWITYFTDITVRHDVVYIGRMKMDYKNMEIHFVEDSEEYGYDGGQHWSFIQLKEQFDRIKKLPVFW